MAKHLNIKVYGLVQGIFYRATAKKEAEKLGIFGFARNEPDGSVYIEAEGEEKDLNQFIKWCKTGPSLSRVDKVEITEELVKDFSEFLIY